MNAPVFETRAAQEKSSGTTAAGLKENILSARLGGFGWVIWLRGNMQPVSLSEQ